MANHFKCFKVAQIYFPQNPQTKDTVQMAIVLVINETATKVALYTYLRLLFILKAEGLNKRKKV